MPCLDRDQWLLWHLQLMVNSLWNFPLFFFVFLFTQNCWDEFSKKHACHLFLFVILLRHFDTYISERMFLPPEDSFLLKHHCENSELCICIFSYKKLFIWIQEYLLKRLDVLISSNVILFILTDKSLQFMNISICFNLKSDEIGRFSCGGLGLERLPLNWVWMC